MKTNGWKDADAWAASADTIAPTIVGGSKKNMEDQILVRREHGKRGRPWELMELVLQMNRPGRILQEYRN